MPEPTIDELQATLTHTSYCAVLQRGAFDRAEVCECWCHRAENQPIHWISDAPTSLHGNGAASFARTTRDAAAVTCVLCRTLLARHGEDVDDYSMCICGRPMDGHPESTDGELDHG